MHMPIVTLDDLAGALAARLGLGREEAEAQAEYVLDIFGFEAEILDNVLAPEDRQLFYAMEAQGLVTARSEETQLHTGQDWRTHTWTLRAEKVLAAAGPRAGRLPSQLPWAHEPPRDADDVYAALPASIWTRR